MLCSQTSPCRPISTLHISMSFLASAVKIPKKILDSLDQIPWRDVLYFRNVSVSTCTVGIWKYFLSKIIYTIALKRLRKMHFLLFCLLFQPVWISFSTLGRTLTACTVFSKWFFNLEAFHVVQLKKTKQWTLFIWVTKRSNFSGHVPIFCAKIRVPKKTLKIDIDPEFSCSV